MSEQEKRVLKFRAWHITQQRMIEGYMDIMVVVGLDVMLNRVADTIVMQFTGVLDKHGKEIYAGDIVFRKNPNFLYEVIWSNEHARWSLRSIYRVKGGKHVYLAINRQVNEIIGNIYETPELLKADGREREPATI